MSSANTVQLRFPVRLGKENNFCFNIRLRTTLSRQVPRMLLKISLDRKLPMRNPRESGFSKVDPRLQWAIRLLICANITGLYFLFICDSFPWFQRGGWYQTAGDLDEIATSWSKDLPEHLKKNRRIIRTSSGASLSYPSSACIFRRIANTLNNVSPSRSPSTGPHGLKAARSAGY